MTAIDYTAEDYHADIVADRPTLSASIAHVLCTRTPLHAWTAHPKLNPEFRRIDRGLYDKGTVAHSILLQGTRENVEVLDFPDWRQKNAQELRDAARADGKIPLLTKEMAAVESMLAAAVPQIVLFQADPPLLHDGKPEQTLVWEEEGGVICRSRLDWLRNDAAAIDDVKTTTRSASPDAYARALFAVGGDVQAAFYLRGLRRLGMDDGRAQFRWIVMETDPPYAVSVISPAPDVLALGTRKVEHALAKWRACLEADSWPGYPARVATANLPSWEEQRWSDRELAEEEAGL